MPPRHLISRATDPSGTVTITASATPSSVAGSASALKEAFSVTSLEIASQASGSAYDSLWSNQNRVLLAIVVIVTVSIIIQRARKVTPEPFVRMPDARIVFVRPTLVKMPSQQGKDGK
ncbi:hypothetical protein BD410DRAFT_805926 [Rickenella mellea]|uniref:Uncharacterized protein n=1 Tax=Rickenella mellea TaxID=50990 RepID=A0A4Y7PVP6_9AGAM|nr:hypothetical protein BD410DRAFT_805926 [Rickenella mellea]